MRKLLVLCIYFYLLFCAIVYIDREYDITCCSFIKFHRAVLAGMDFLYSKELQSRSFRSWCTRSTDYLKIGWKM